MVVPVYVLHDFQIDVAKILGIWSEVGDKRKDLKAAGVHANKQDVMIVQEFNLPLTPEAAREIVSEALGDEEAQTYFAGWGSKGAGGNVQQGRETSLSTDFILGQKPVKDPRKDTDWVMAHLHSTEPDVKGCPSQIAWSLLKEAQGNKDVRKGLVNAWSTKNIVVADDGQRMVDDGRLLQRIDQIERAVVDGNLDFIGEAAPVAESAPISDDPDEPETDEDVEAILGGLDEEDDEEDDDGDS